MARGAYSNTGMPPGIAHSAAPRACPSLSALSTLRLTKTRSMATSAGRCSASSAARLSKIMRNRAVGAAPLTFRCPCASSTSSPSRHSSTPKPVRREPGSRPRIRAFGEGGGGAAAAAAGSNARHDLVRYLDIRSSLTENKGLRIPAQAGAAVADNRIATALASRTELAVYLAPPAVPPPAGIFLRAASAPLEHLVGDLDVRVNLAHFVELLEGLEEAHHALGGLTRELNASRRPLRDFRRNRRKAAMSEHRAHRVELQRVGQHLHRLVAARQDVLRARLECRLQQSLLIRAGRIGHEADDIEEVAHRAIGTEVPAVLEKCPAQEVATGGAVAREAFDQYRRSSRTVALEAHQLLSRPCPAARTGAPRLPRTLAAPDTRPAAVSWHMTQKPRVMIAANRGNPSTLSARRPRRHHRRTRCARARQHPRPRRSRLRERSRRDHGRPHREHRARQRAARARGGRARRSHPGADRRHRGPRGERYRSGAAAARDARSASRLVTGAGTGCPPGGNAAQDAARGRERSTAGPGTPRGGAGRAAPRARGSCGRARAARHGSARHLCTARQPPGRMAAEVGARGSCVPLPRAG